MANPYYKPRPPKPCPTCNQTFEKVRKQEVYCSLECAIMPRIERRGVDECWPWTGGLTNGYGAGTFHKKRYKVTRWLMERKLGRKLAREEFVCHSCDNPACCNLDHLWIGSPADNMRDKVEKGRQRNGTADMRGERHPKAKLNADAVIEIWKHRHEGSQIALAKKFGVSRGVVWRVMKGRSWTSVTKNLP